MADVADSSSQPLLHESHDPAERSNANFNYQVSNPHSGSWIRRYNRGRESLRKFLATKTQHTIILALVSLDVLGIFADIFLNLYECEEGKQSPKIDKVRNALGIAGLVFSCLFMAELTMSFWAFGWSYFTSWFHIFDAIVIAAAFVIDVLLRGVLEEVASLVVILRLWRFFKIIEEFSVGAQEQMDGLEERLEGLERENEKLKAELARSKGRDLDEEASVGLDGQS